MENSNIENFEFIGYTNGKALTINNHINIFRVFLFTTPLYLSILFAVIFKIEEIIVLSFFPSLFLIFSFVVLLFKKLEDKYLEGAKKKFKFIINQGILSRDGKIIKSFTNWRIYRYRKFLFIISSKKFYLVYNPDFTKGTREQFLKWAISQGIKVKRGIII